MATIDLPAVDSDVNVFVTAMNVFGSGPASNIVLNEISQLIYTVFVYMYIHNIYDEICPLNKVS